MKHITDQPLILIAEDDPDDRLLFDEALNELGLREQVAFVDNGEELLLYLRKLHLNSGDSQRPMIVLLDLNMPRKDGREALREIKEDPKLRSIPVVVMTTSTLEDDVQRSYELGVNSFITKPATFERLVEALDVVTTYWLKTVRLPGERA